MRKGTGRNQLRWGILSSGTIANDFCLALSTLPKEHHQVIHVAARDIGRAKQFAELFGIKTYSDSYAKVTEDENVDVVYIATLNNTHKDLSILALNHGKAVLCEKPAAMNTKELDEVLKVAKEKNVFYMEALWSRTLPIYHDFLSKLRIDKVLGNVSTVTATFGYKGLMTFERVATKQFGGGVFLSFGIYLVMLADLIFEDDRLLEISACGHVDSESNIDQVVVVNMKYEGNKMAQLHCHYDVDFPNDAYIHGENGSMHIEFPFYAPTRFTTHNKNGSIQEYLHTLPKADREVTFHNSIGLRFEAEHVRKCLQKELVQSPMVSHDTSKRLMGYIDDVLEQLGASY